MGQSNGRIAALAALSLLAFAGAAAAQDDGGFAISDGGKIVAGSAGVAKMAKQTASATAANVQVKADGLGVKPRLDLEITAVSRQTASVQSRMNYPAWVVRGEVRLIDPVRGRILQTVAIAPNGAANISLPAKGLVAVYRVYDAAGRYDETAAVGLDAVRASPQEEGNSTAVRRGIPISGGAVTVYGSGLAPGASVETLGETLRADAAGAFVLQRILPAGDQSIAVRITGAGPAVFMQPLVNIPRSEWFTVATADLTFGKELSGANKGDTYSKGRLAYYTNGKIVSGWEITSSADTGEAPLGDVFRDFDRKDPLGVLSRLDPSLAYPVYGDDSTLENDAPTNGKFYFKAERDGSHLVWGNFKGELAGAQYLRNERTLYGFQGVYRMPAQTTQGEARLAATLYAAQPDNLPGREVFLGTGGSVYFLNQQDISIGSETLSVERRDPITGRVIEQRRLVAGRDYQINYIQGVITLSAPLSGFGSGGTVVTTPGSATEIRLVAQYEFTPTSTDISGFAYGARVEGWVSDQLRLGVTGMAEQTGSADQTAAGIDLHYEFGVASVVDAEFARTDGPGFGSTYSADGGLIINSAGAGTGSGQGYRFKTSVDLADLGLVAEGAVSAYAERRTAGFSTLDYQTTANESLWGVAIDAAASDRMTYHLAYDAFENDAGKTLNEGSAALNFKQSDRITWDLGLTRQERVEPGVAAKNGQRTDLAARLTVAQSDRLTWSVFGQTTLDRSGGRARNDRLGVGAKLAFAKGWTFEGEVSGGTAGAGGKALINYENASNSAYLGYTLDPGREVDGVALTGRDSGKFVAGGKRQINDSTEVFGENTYDMFGRRKSLVSSYGVKYQSSKFLTLTGGFELGRVRGASTIGASDDLDRRAFSLGLQYQDDGGLSAKARLELRQDRGTAAGAARNSDSVLISGNLTYEVSAVARWLATVDAANTDTDGSSVLSGDYAKATIGYAFRPVDNDRLNLLAKYTFVYDMYGQRVDNTDETGPRQKTHVFSIDAIYDIGQKWQIGGKLGYRLSQSAPDGVVALAKNDAALAVINARYHLNTKWDVLLEGRYLVARQAGVSEFGALATVYRQVGNNLMLGVGYDFGAVSDDLTDLTASRQGVFLNLIAKY